MAMNFVWPQEPYCHIVCTEREGPYGVREVTDWQLDGPGPFFLAELSKRHSYGDVVHVGPFRFRWVNYSVSYLADVLVLDNAWALPRLAAYWIKQHARWVYWRLILTLHVWGLADRHRGYEPSWRDVPFLRRLARV